MPKDKERTLNPAAAQRKAEKQKALKKGKAAVAAQRNERLAHRNPDRLQAQIDELKAQQSDRGQLSQRDQDLLANLERDVGRIRKAKAAAGYPQSGPGERPRGNGDGDSRQILGKRQRPYEARHRSPVSSDTDEGVENIPMPRDTPPPIPRRRLDKRHHGPDQNANTAPEVRPQPAAQIIYESKPVIRDLRKEATGLVPSVVKRKLDAVRGGLQQPLLEEDELDQLEKEGYVAKHGAADRDQSIITGNITEKDGRQQAPGQSKQAWVEDAEDNG